jgi:carotenoid cleavage dioxygenase-like enzyme
MASNISQTYYSSQKTETPETSLLVKGKIPDWISGKFLKNGPAVFEAGSTQLRHWFDGYALLHRFDIHNGQVTYMSKLLQSPEYQKSVSSPHNSYVTWGTSIDPCESLFSRFKLTFVSPSNTSVNIVKIKDNYYTTSDISSASQFDSSSLNTLTTHLGKNGVMAAHPGFDSDGTVWNMLSTFGPVSRNSFVSIDENFQSTSHHTFTTKQSYYSHSFANTDTYIASIEQPMYLSFQKLLTAGIRNRSFFECFDWDTSKHNIIHLYHKKTQQYISIPLNEQFFYFHTINSFEEDNILYIDLCGYNNNEIINEFYLDTLKQKGLSGNHKAHYYRLTVHLDQNEASLERTEISLELPICNTRFLGKQYQYAYGVQSSQNSPYLADRLIKIDLFTQQTTIWEEEHTLVSEPYFIEENQSSEDSGVISSICFDTITSQSFLLLLNARDMTEIARAYTPHFIPAPLHGCFYPDTEQE